MYPFNPFLIEKGHLLVIEYEFFNLQEYEIHECAFIINITLCYAQI